MTERVSAVEMMSRCPDYYPSSALAPWFLEFLRKLYFPFPLFPFSMASLLSPPPHPPHHPLGLFVW